MDDEPLTLDRLYTAIEQHIEASFPVLEFIATWPDIRESVPLPALFLELSEFEPGTEVGTGQTALVCRFEARVIVGPEDALHNQQAALLAAQLAVLLRAQYWGLPDVDAAEFVRAVPDWTKPELDGYTVWLVEWTQPIKLGVEEWPWPDGPATYLPAALEPGAVEVRLEG